MTQLSIEQIVIEPNVYPRAWQNWKVSQTYFRNMLSGVKFPPITVSQIEGKYILIDGAHRLQATKMYCIKQKQPLTIEAEIIECKNYDEAYLQAIQRNISHGQPLSIYEKMLIYQKLKPKHTEKFIANVLQLDASYLKMLVKKRIIKKDSEEIVLKTPMTHLDETSTITKEDQKVFTGASQLSLVNQLIQIIENGWLDTENKELHEKLDTLRKWLDNIPTK